MGTFEFGIYVYVWTWVLLIGQALDLGLATAAQRFIPEYRERGMLALLRGYVSGSRWLAVGIAIGVAVLVRRLRVADRAVDLDHYIVIPLYLACVACRPMRSPTCRTAFPAPTTGSALGIVPTYIVRQLLLTVLMAAAYFARSAARTR